MERFHSSFIPPFSVLGLDDRGLFLPSVPGSVDPSPDLGSGRNDSFADAVGALFWRLRSRRGWGFGLGLVDWLASLHRRAAAGSFLPPPNLDYSLEFVFGDSGHRRLDRLGWIQRFDS